MSFSADWLALRAQADREARDPALAADLAAHLQDYETLSVLDLGSGTGANINALGPLFGANQCWTLVDNDKALLDAVTAPDGINLKTRLFDLSDGIAALFDPAPDLVTASAFFDLCGAEFIDALVAQIVAADAVFYTTITYDGRESWQPPHKLDAAVLDAFHKDQCRDKGLGPALGPGATEYLEAALIRAGYSVFTAQSDWQITLSEGAELLAALSKGTAEAVAHTVGDAAAQEWHDARQTAAHAMIGHQDLLAIPPGRAIDQ